MSGFRWGSRWAIDRSTLNVPIIIDARVPLTRTRTDGGTEDALCWLIRSFDGKLTEVRVHPDRYDLFVMSINQPDIAAHPEVLELLKKPKADR